MTFIPSSHVGPPALLGGPLNSKEPASSSTDNPVTTALPFFFPKGKGKNYSTPPSYAQHFGYPDPPSDEDAMPEENVMTLPQESFKLPNDVAHSHRYSLGKGKGNKGGPLSRESLPTPLSIAIMMERGSRCNHLARIHLMMMMMLLMDGMNGEECRRPHMLLRKMEQV